LSVFFWLLRGLESLIIEAGTLLYGLDLKTMFSVLNVSKQKINDKMIKSARERITCVGMHCNIGRMGVYKVLVNAFTEDKDY